MALVAVDLVAAQLSLFPVRQVAQGLLCTRAVWLPALRCIDPTDADLDLLIFAGRTAAGSNGVAVRDANNETKEGGCEHAAV